MCARNPQIYFRSSLSFRCYNNSGIGSCLPPSVVPGSGCHSLHSLSFCVITLPLSPRSLFRSLDFFSHSILAPYSIDCAPLSLSHWIRIFAFPVDIALYPVVRSLPCAPVSLSYIPSVFDSLPLQRWLRYTSSTSSTRSLHVPFQIVLRV